MAERCLLICHLKNHKRGGEFYPSPGEGTWESPVIMVGNLTEDDSRELAGYCGKKFKVREPEVNFINKTKEKKMDKHFRKLMVKDQKEYLEKLENSGQ